MSGVSVERPHSKSILTVFTLVCFGLFSVGLALTLQTLGVTPDRAFVFMAFLMAVFLASLGVAFRSGRFYFASYRWTFWVALVVPALLITRVTAFFDAGAEVVRTPGTIGFLYGLLDLTSFLLAGLLAVVWIAGMRIARAIELLHPQVSEVPPSA
ncbi:MAG: hypothetical protein FJ029_10120, partial [Actinobacteria bacterium]|nr:hypothetical protein [Actinomycetota bacterium]